MPAFFSMLFLIVAVSLDGLGVGVMYGLRKIRIPFVSILIISLCSGFIMLLSMLVGVYVSHYVSPVWGKTCGAAILIAIGCWALRQMAIQRKQDIKWSSEVLPLKTETIIVTETTRAVVTIELRWLGLVIQVLRSPQDADRDRSGTISAAEAALLGTALSLDAFGAGIGAALIGLIPLVTAIIITLSSGVFLILGLKIGTRFVDVRLLRQLSFLPGCILIIMGILKLV